MNRRQHNILQKLKKHGSLSIENEAIALKVSSMTIRRDIQFLVNLGLAIKTHGGAVSRQSNLDQLFIKSKITEKQKYIASKTIELIPENCSIMLSTGTTTLEVARQLATSTKHLSVITNSLPIAATLYQTNIQVILTGGNLRTNSLDLVGPVTEKNLDEYYIDILISGCDGAIATEGFFTKDLSLAKTEKKSVEKSRKVIIVTESHKFDHPALVKFASPNQVDMLISDTGLSILDRKKLEEQHVEVILNP